MDLDKTAKHNAKIFILYRILFRARFYYPVFTLLFLDFGLSLSQFAILNSVWALTIVIFEIPLGGLKYSWQKKSCCFIGNIIEYRTSNLALAPIHGGDTLFIFLANRIISFSAALKPQPKP